ncbi:MAG: archaeosine biosynthesis radical SAM protein RaSEA [Candidatus Thorarchaeota archaeon]|nr:archaeosine biosynthesis radical SAM protein RaSEA [Candidatus Thorarchaeota archaeon]
MSFLVNSVVNATLRARGQSIQRRKKRNPTHPAAKWKSPIQLAGDKGTALAVVLSTVGCSHARGPAGGCTMCSYLLDGNSVPPSSEDIVTQFRTALQDLQGEQPPFVVKIYTSGSFLDPSEVPADARRRILEMISAEQDVRQVVLESRPEYVTEASLVEVRHLLGDRLVELGMGLETINDSIRSMCINKGFTYAQFADAVRLALDHGVGTRAYVLLKPPFLTERDALLDSTATIEEAIRLGVSSVSVNPVDIQRDTLVERLWSSGEYRPPWLWTVVEVLRLSRSRPSKSTPILCEPAASGKMRGPHNCGACDTQFTSAVRAFSLDQDTRHFDALECWCRELWRNALRHEDVSLITQLDLLGTKSFHKRKGP